MKVNIANGLVRVEGPKGKLEQAIHPNMKVASDGKAITVTRPDDADPHAGVFGDIVAFHPRSHANAVAEILLG